MFVFSNTLTKKWLQLQPFVYVDEHDMRVVSIDCPERVNQGVLKVALFEQGSPIKGLDLCKYLEMFVSYGIIGVGAHSSLCHTIFTHIDTFHSIFHGYEVGLFRLIARLSGDPKTRGRGFRAVLIDRARPKDRKVDFPVRWLSQKVTVEVSPEIFTFTSASKTIDIPTHVYLAYINGEMTIVSIGEEPIGNTEVFRVDLFEEKSKFSEVDRYDCLERFIRHGLIQVISKYTFIAPTVIYRNTETLDLFFHGYSKGLFELISDPCPGHGEVAFG